MKTKAKVFWLIEDNANIKFFHASASIRRKTNRIPYLESDNGVQVNDKEGMCSMVKDYFTDIFRDEQHTSMDHVSEETRYITDAQNQMLVEELTFVEFTTAVK